MEPSEAVICLPATFPHMAPAAKILRLSSSDRGSISVKNSNPLGPACTRDFGTGDALTHAGTETSSESGTARADPYARHCSKDSRVCMIKSGLRLLRLTVNILRRGADIFLSLN